MNAKRFLTTKEVAERACVSKAQVYKLLRENVLHRVRLEGCTKVLIDSKEVDAWIDEALKSAAAS
jgi:excisionase family DNA binding protein